MSLQGNISVHGSFKSLSYSTKSDDDNYIIEHDDVKEEDVEDNDNNNTDYIWLTDDAWKVKAYMPVDYVHGECTKINFFQQFWTEAKALGFVNTTSNHNYRF